MHHAERARFVTLGLADLGLIPELDGHAHRAEPDDAHMTDKGLPTYLNRGVHLSKEQLRTQLGAELLSLLQSVTADGRIDQAEITGLRQWLHDAEAAEMLPARYLRTIIERVLADGQITAAEYAELYRVVEAVLPIEARGQAVAARRAAATAGEAAARTDDSFRRVVRMGLIALGILVLVFFLIGPLTRD